MLKPLSRDTLTQQAADTLRRFIFQQELQAGTRLPSERELSETLAISRNVVREALSYLVAEGLIEKQAGRGIFVRDFDGIKITQVDTPMLNSTGWPPTDVSEARAVIELGAAQLMARRITAGQLQELEQINERIAERQRAGFSWIKEDLEFHKVLLEATHNAVLTELFPLFVEYFRLEVVHHPNLIRRHSDWEGSELVVREHNQIIAALAARDSAAVQAALLAHPLDFQRPDSAVTEDAASQESLT